MPILLLLALVLTVAAVVGLVTWRYPRVTAPTPNSTIATAREVGKTVSRHPRLRALLAPRLNPETATGLALTVAMIAAIAGGVVFGVLAYLIRTNANLLGIDNGVAKWGNRHATATSTHVLNDLTQLGGIYVVVGLCVVLAVAETFRQRSVWVPLFIIAVMGGEEDLDVVRQATCGPCPPDIQSRGRDARAVIPKRPLGDCRRLLRDGSTSHREVAPSPHAGGDHRACRRDRSRGCSDSRPTGRALANGCDRRALARLGMVRGLRNRLRRTNSAFWCGSRDSHPGSGENHLSRIQGDAPIGSALHARLTDRAKSRCCALP